MTDVPAPPDPPAPAAGAGGFCGECGAALEPGAAYCGMCGTATPAAVAAAATPPPAGPAEGASNWTGVQPVIERPDEAPAAATPEAPAAPTSGPTAGGPPAGGPPAGGPPPAAAARKGRGPLVALIVVLLAALGAGAFLVLGGDDDDAASDDTTTTTEADEETTTTTEVDDTTTTVEVPGVEFVSLTDATGQLTVEVPSDWTDVSLALEGSDGLANIQASTDLASFRTRFEVPGMSFTLLPTPPADGNFDQVLDFLASTVNLPNACVSTGKQDYSDGVFTGRLEIWQECAGIGTQIVMISAAQADGRAIEINVQLPVEEPFEIAQHIVETFLIVG